MSPKARLFELERRLLSRDREHLETLDEAVKVEEDRNALLRAMERIAKAKTGVRIARRALAAREVYATSLRLAAGKGAPAP